MYLVKMDEPRSNLKRIDDEIDEYELVNIDSISVRLSQEETLKFGHMSICNRKLSEYSCNY